VATNGVADMHAPGGTVDASPHRRARELGMCTPPPVAQVGKAGHKEGEGGDDGCVTSTASRAHGPSARVMCCGVQLVSSSSRLSLKLQLSSLPCLRHGGSPRGGASFTSDSTSCTSGVVVCAVCDVCGDGAAGAVSGSTCDARSTCTQTRARGCQTSQPTWRSAGGPHRRVP